MQIIFQMINNDINACMCVFVCVYVCIYVCMYVCIGSVYKLNNNNKKDLFSIILIILENVCENLYVICIESYLLN